MRRRLRKFIKELYRRKVVRVVVAYLAILASVVGWLASTKAEFNIPEGGVLIIAIAGLVLAPLVAYLAWRYDIVPPQLVRDVKDVQAENPGLSWARLRHEVGDAGYILLTWISSDGSRIEKRFFQPVAIGREVGNDIEIADDRVSRHHAVLWAENGNWHVRDLESANGTFVGHSRVSDRQELPPTCDLRLHVNGPIVGVTVARAAATRVG